MAGDGPDAVPAETMGSEESDMPVPLESASRNGARKVAAAGNYADFSAPASSVTISAAAAVA